MGVGLRSRVSQAQTLDDVPRDVCGYRTIGPNYDAVILDPNMQGLVRTIISRFTAQEIITKRALATQQAEAVLKARLASSHIVVTGLNLVNLHFSAAFEQAQDDLPPSRSSFRWAC